MEKMTVPGAPRNGSDAPPDVLQVVAEGLGLRSTAELAQRFRSTRERTQLMETLMRDPRVMEYANKRGLHTEEVHDALLTLSKTYESKESFLKRSWKFIKRNKWYILGGAAAIGAGVAAYYYWPALAGFAVTAKGAVRGWLRKFLGVPDMPAMSAVVPPAVPGVPGVGGNPAPNVLPAAPAPRPVDPGALLDKFGDVK